jgi:hypothetical protein
VGVRADVSVDPEQFYFGGHAETPPLVDRLHFRPNIEIGIGDETTIAAFNLEFAHQFRSPEAWNVYAGAGPALHTSSTADVRPMQSRGSTSWSASRMKTVCSPK